MICRLSTSVVGAQMAAFWQHLFYWSYLAELMVDLAGHGVGAWWRQQEPYMAPSGKYILEEGLVVALEPHIGNWRLQDMVLITDGEPRLLSPLINTDEMLAAG